MADEATIAASSPAEEADPFKGEFVSLSEFSKYRQDGEVPARFKPAEPADSTPADEPEETETAEGEDPEPDPDSDPDDEPQEQPQKGSGAEKRIKQLLAKQKELERKLEEVAQKDAKPGSSPAQTVQQAQPPATRTKPAAEDKKADGTPKYATYEEFVEELADWKAEQRWAAKEHERAEQQAKSVLEGKLNAARERYENADDAIFPAAQAINTAQIPAAVKAVFEQSDVFVDLCYVVGSDKAELKKFIALAQTNPRAALAKVFEYERGIKEELAKTDGTEPKPKGDTAPEPKKTSAPKPPSPVGGSSRGTFDVNDENSDIKLWRKQRDAQVKRRS